MDYGNAVIVDDLAAFTLDPPGKAAAAVYDRPIGLRLLHQDAESGEEHYLVRYPAGLQGRLHEHSFAHTIVVLDGKLNVNGQIIGPTPTPTSQHSRRCDISQRETPLACSS